ncbi:hypothetical protein C0Q70_14043 [Pomacea canaliculata]|uniref:Uncharacterized protein n=1 Tax=Pomacea canaliculata TaxID=400727 RepID=A0A2T7NYX4_POMCA|nr:hypothetical protein C0Q70_14043 [Pomacea canaliculata]
MRQLGADGGTWTGQLLVAPDGTRSSGHGCRGHGQGVSTSKSKTASHAYELLGLLHRQTQAAGFAVVQTSRAYPIHPSAHGYGYALAQAHAHRPFSPPSSASASGLAPLQKLCASDSSAFKSRGESSGVCSSSPESGTKALKFGISRILDEDFGKSRNEKAMFRSVMDSCMAVFSSDYMRIRGYDGADFCRLVDVVAPYHRRTTV